MRVPPQQQGGKARAEGGGRQQAPSIPNCSHIPRRQTRPDAHLQTAPGLSEGEDHIESCPHPTPGRDHLGSCHKDAADLHPGTCLPIEYISKLINVWKPHTTRILIRILLPSNIVVECNGGGKAVLRCKTTKHRHFGHRHLEFVKIINRW